MCGIIGYFENSELKKSKFNPQILVQASRTLRHRGPDGEGSYYYRNDLKATELGFYHLRLSLLDLTHEGNQPMVSYDGNWVLIFNGEIYNYSELYSKYNFNFSLKGDTRVGLETIANKGMEAIKEWNGMFAGAVFCIPDQKLYLFRDRFGIKPLVYYLNSNSIAFASELKAILAMGIDREINKEVLEHYLKFEFLPREERIIKNVFSVPKGNILELNTHGDTIKLQKTPFYIPLFEFPEEQNFRIKENQLVEELDSLINKSVNLQLRSDAPIGGFLSGGTDSSVIMAQACLNKNVDYPTFTVGFDIKSYDESEYARNVSNSLKGKNYCCIIDENTSLIFVEHIYDYYDEPFAVPSVIPTYFLCKFASENDYSPVNAALSGDGGDELFRGYGHYSLASRLWMLNKYSLGMGIPVLKFILSSLNRPDYHRKARYLLTRENLSCFPANIWSQSQDLFNTLEIKKLLKEPFSSSEVNFNEFFPDEIFLSNGIQSVLQYFDLNYYFPQDLAYKMDIASMAHGLEVRLPLMDNDILNFSLKISPNLMIKNGVKKYLLKKVLEKYLPKELVHRPKWGFPAPMEQWLMGRLSYLIPKYLNSNALKTHDLFDEEFINKLVWEFKNGKKFHYKRIWVLISFQMWYDRYISPLKN